MADKAWKRFERRVGSFFGTSRNALSGMNSKLTASDTLHPSLFIECKQRQSFAHHTTYLDAKGKAKQEGKIPILVTHEKGAKDFLITCSSKDLLAVAAVLTQTVTESQDDLPKPVRKKFKRRHKTVE